MGGAEIRVLVLCAEIGEGHLTAANALAAELRTREVVSGVALRTDLQVLGRRFGRFMELGLRAHLGGIGSPHDQLSRLSYELGYRLFFERALPRAAGQRALLALGGSGLLETVSKSAADVVVADYPVISAVLGQLRARGRLSVPVCSSISDPAGLWYWAHPGIDMHLLCWPESLTEVERIAGPGRAVAVRPLIDRRYADPPTRARARAALALPADQPVIIVSGGGWGVGDLVGAADVALAVLPQATVICLAGRSREAQRRLRSAHGASNRVRILSFTQRMPELLAAADVLIHTTGGSTSLEARVAGCRLISYGTSVAHVRRHAQALAELGIAMWAKDRAELARALPRALTQPAPTPLALDGLPSAAEIVIELASRRGSVRASAS